MAFIEDFQANERKLDYEEKVVIAEGFLERYNVTEARNVYRWLWEGEFGAGSRTPTASLEQLSQDIRVARMHARRADYTPSGLCEEIGLAQRFIKVNLVPYADSGCPLKRLVLLADRGREARPDPLRFKSDWAFMKTQIVPGMELTIDRMNHFEEEIAFHMAPEVEYSEDHLKKFGVGYRLVPRSLFFAYFPEYAPETESDDWLPNINDD